jgi:Fic family protein
MLFKALPLDRAEGAVLERIADLKRQLAFAISPKRWYGLLRRNTFARAIQGSNSIEGYNISIDDAVAAVEGEQPIDPKTENWLANVCYCRAMTLVLQKAEAPDFEYSKEFLNALHYMMLEYDLTKHPGNWRTGPVFVHNSKTEEIVYEGPPAEGVPALIDELVAELNEPQPAADTIVRGAMAHLNFVMIHPHSDGNGRMGRCLQTLVLARGGTVNPVFASIEEYLGRNTGDYYRVLGEVGAGAWHPQRNTRPWIRFNLTAHFRQATTLLYRSRHLANIFEVCERLAEEHGLDSRTTFALADAATGYKVRNATYRPSADISQKSATRDLSDLVAAGLLVKKGRKRGTYYERSEELLKQVVRVPPPAKVPDPFEAREPILPGMKNLVIEG